MRANAKGRRHRGRGGGELHKARAACARTDAVRSSGGERRARGHADPAPPCQTRWRAPVAWSAKRCPCPSRRQARRRCPRPRRCSRGEWSSPARRHSARRPQQDTRRHRSRPPRQAHRVVGGTRRRVELAVSKRVRRAEEAAQGLDGVTHAGGTAEVGQVLHKRRGQPRCRPRAERRGTRSRQRGARAHRALAREAELVAQKRGSERVHAAHRAPHSVLHDFDTASTGPCDSAQPHAA